MTEPPELITDVSQLSSTCYFEFLPGKYEGVCWNKQSVYLAEEVFDIIEGLVRSIVPNFDHYAFHEVDAPTVDRLINTLRDSARKIEQAQSPSDLTAILYLHSQTVIDLKDIYTKQASVATMMRELSNWLEETIKSHTTISVLGM